MLAWVMTTSLNFIKKYDQNLKSAFFIDLQSGLERHWKKTFKVFINFRIKSGLSATKDIFSNRIKEQNRFPLCTGVSLK